MNAKDKRTIKRIRKELIVSSQEKEWINRHLHREPTCEEESLGENETIAYTVEFGDGIEMDIKICGVRYQEGQPNKAWTEAVLFENGCEVAHTDPDDAFFQEWICENEGVEYVVVVETYDNIAGKSGTLSKRFCQSPAFVFAPGDSGQPAEKNNKVEVPSATKTATIEVPCTAGTLCAQIGGDPNFPEIFTYLRRADGVEIDITAVCGDGIAPAGVSPDDFDGQKKNDGGLTVYLYKDTSRDEYSDNYRLSKAQLDIEYN